jgi:hypothetical protein
MGSGFSEGTALAVQVEMPECHTDVERDAWVKGYQKRL